MDVRDVLVVGGGPAGASTAALCARAGLDVLAGDRAVFPRDKPCAEYLSPECARDLEALGVQDELLAAGAQRLVGMRIVSDDGGSVTGRFDASPGHAPYRPYGLAVRRTVLDTALLRAAAREGAEVREGVALERLVVERGKVTGAMLRSPGGPEEVRARVVVGADGLNSRVARQLRLGRRGRPRRLALVAHLDRVAGLTDCGEMFCGPGWYVGVAALGAGVASVAMVVPVADGPQIAGDPEGYFRRRLSELPELAERVAEARMVRPILAAGPFARRVRDVVVEFAATLNATVPVPEPLAPLVIVIQATELTALQLHPVLMETVKDPVPPALLNACSTGLIEGGTQRPPPPAWLMVTVVPAGVIVVERAVPTQLAMTVRVTAAAPEPAAAPMSAPSL